MFSKYEAGMTKREKRMHLKSTPPPPRLNLTHLDPSMSSSTCPGRCFGEKTSTALSSEPDKIPAANWTQSRDLRKIDNHVLWVFCRALFTADIGETEGREAGSSESAILGAVLNNTDPRLRPHAGGNTFRPLRYERVYLPLCGRYTLLYLKGRFINNVRRLADVGSIRIDPTWCDIC